MKKYKKIDLFMSWFNTTAFVYSFFVLFFLNKDMDIASKIFFFIFNISSGLWTIFWNNRLNREEQ